MRSESNSWNLLLSVENGIDTDYGTDTMMSYVISNQMLSDNI